MLVVLLMIITTLLILHVDGFDSSSINSDASGSNGTATIDSATGVWTYTPNGDYNGTDTFTVVVTDVTGATTEQVVNVTVNAVGNYLFHFSFVGVFFIN